MMCGACDSRVRSIVSSDERVDSVVVNMLTKTAAIKLKDGSGLWLRFAAALTRLMFCIPLAFLSAMDNKMVHQIQHPSSSWTIDFSQMKQFPGVCGSTGNRALTSDLEGLLTDKSVPVEKERCPGTREEQRLRFGLFPLLKIQFVYSYTEMRQVGVCFS